MILIEWSSGQGQCSCVAPNDKSAWAIYWAVKTSLRKTRLASDAWMTVWDRGYRDPLKGGSMPWFKEGENYQVVLQKAENETP